MFDPFPPFVSSEFQVKYATEPWERRGAAALRRAVFCEEQGVFAGDDRDAIDDIATPIVALSSLTVAPDEVVGTVRIHEEAPGLWWGSRLAVAKRYRRVGTLGTALIRLAVRSANARGCTLFLAHVQAGNALLFQRLSWDVIEPVELHGRPHFLMQARLEAYPPFATPETGFRAHRKAAA
ncbi:MSMEG_0567/Sll0786 family nitrogen starvation N-acetyltransferase [Chelatococcus sambhunathii]